MTRLAVLVGFAAAIGSATLAAQDTAPQTTGTKDAVTLTGCLQAGTADTFTLSNVTQAAASSTATGTSGTATATASAGDKKADMKYELVSSGSVDLKPHVGHKVEITGTPEAKDAAGTTGAAASEASASAGSSASSASVKKIKVTAVKHVAASCS